MSVFDTEFSADAVEFCSFSSLIAIGTYQIEKQEESSTGSKKGRLLLFNNGQMKPIDTAAILDLK